MKNMVTVLHGNREFSIILHIKVIRKGRYFMKLGVAGTGAMAREVLPLLDGWGWKVTALCGTARSKAAVDGLCREYQIGAAYCDYDAMLAQEDVDAVYIAVPNFLHESFVRKALENGRNVIVEKPIASNDKEAEGLAAIAREKDLYLFEAITTVNQPNFHKIKSLLPRIGKVRAISCNFSQYSHRYDAFLAGETPPVFDRAKSGGALMDLNLYNLYFVLGLFGEPKSVSYHANMERGIDTSGILTLSYDTFHAACIGAKDCSAPCGCVIQGSKGYICQDTPANICGAVTLHLNDGTREHYDENPAGSRLEPEFRLFAQEIRSGGRRGCYEMLDQSLLVSRIQTRARIGAGIYFPADDIGKTGCYISRR